MEAKIYVGTYAKYNEGDLHGQWLDITQFDQEEFATACAALHADEDSPELMYQDYEGILTQMPRQWISESTVSPDLWTYIDTFSGDELRGEHFLTWLSHAGYVGDFGYLLSQFEEAYEGAYDKPKDYAEMLIEEMGIYEKMGNMRYYFDTEAFTRDLFMSDYYFIDGVVFRNL